MQTTTRSSPTPAGPSRAAARGPWSITQYLAVIGVASFVYGSWTILSWLADGIRSVTAPGERDDASWYAARVYEGLAVLVAVVVATAVIRRVRREGRFTFDAQFCLAWAALYWIDPMINWLAPIWMYSSNWVNVANWCGHMPGIRNVDCGALPEPFLFLWLVYAFGFLAFIMGMNAAMNAVKRRWPGISTARIVVFAVVGGMVVDLLFELPMYRLHLWGFPGAPHELALMDGTNRYPLVQLLFGAMVFTPCAMLRYAKDDRGLTLTERHLERYPARIRPVISTLALYGFVTIIGVVVCLGSAAVGLYADPYPKMPAHLVNRMCDAPGISNTAYGPCPGGDGRGGWNQPVRRLAGN